MSLPKNPRSPFEGGEIAYRQVQTSSSAQPVAFRWRRNQIDDLVNLVVPDGDIVLLGGDYYTVSLGPDSDVAAVFVKPNNGPEMLVTRERALPPGPWRGPFTLRWNSLGGGKNGAQWDGEVPLNSIAYNGSPPLWVIPMGISLDFWPQKDNPPEIYRSAMRHDLLLSPALAGAADQAIVADIPFYGRSRLTLSARVPGANAFSFDLYGLQLLGAIAVPLGTFTIAGASSAAMVIDANVDGDFDRIRMRANGVQPAAVITLRTVATD